MHTYDLSIWYSSASFIVPHLASSPMIGTETHVLFSIPNDFDGIWDVWDVTKKRATAEPPQDPWGQCK